MIENNYSYTTIEERTSSIAASWSRDRTSRRTIWRGEGSQLLDICAQNATLKSERFMYEL